MGSRLRGAPGLTASALLVMVGIGLSSAACGSAAGPTGEVAAVDDGYTSAPPPPLPTAAPAPGFDPDTELASADGTVVAGLGSGRLELRRAGEGRSVAFDVTEDVELRALAADGSRVALLGTGAGGGSRITVIDTGFGLPPGAGSGAAAFPADGASAVAPTFTVDLPGRVEPEAFATDGSLLYVIDHGAGSIPGSYRVRPLDLATGQLAEALGPDKVPLDEDMTGRGNRQVWSPDGTRLYTLYLRQTHHDGAGGAGPGGSGTDGFVHVLDLREEWAFCLDLPPGFGGGELSASALAVSPDGSTVAVVNAEVGQVAFASTSELVITGTRPLPEAGVGADGAAVHAALTTGELAVTWDDRLVWLDRVTLAPAGQGEVALRGPVRGLTSIGDRVLVWPRDGAEPYELAPGS